MTNALGEVIQGNKAFCAITGQQISHVIGLSLKDVLVMDDRRVWDDIYLSLSDHGFWQNEAVIVTARAKSVPVWMGMSAIHNDLGELVSHIIIFSDITLSENPMKQSYTGWRSMMTLPDWPIGL